MSGNLRTRIAAIINAELPWDGPNLSEYLADAVIRELRLSVDRGVVIGCDGKCATDECGCPNWETDDE